MAVKTDSLRVPSGYGDSIEQFVIPVIETAFNKCETHETFDDAYFYEALESHLLANEQAVVRALSDRAVLGRIIVDSLYDDCYNALDYRDRFEVAAKDFIQQFLADNRHIPSMIASNGVWNVIINPASRGNWILICHI